MEYNISKLMELIEDLPWREVALAFRDMLMHGREEREALPPDSSPYEGVPAYAEAVAEQRLFPAAAPERVYSVRMEVYHSVPFATPSNPSMLSSPYRCIITESESPDWAATSFMLPSSSCANCTNSVKEPSGRKPPDA